MTSNTPDVIYIAPNNMLFVSGYTGLDKERLKELLTDDIKENHWDVESIKKILDKEVYGE